MPAKKKGDVPDKEQQANSKSKPAKKKPAEETTLTHKRDESAFPIVGMGASAGGLEAFERFFTHMPPENGMAFVLVPHLDPTHISIMPE